MTGKWHDPKYSLRRQAELVKLAREHGVEELLPYTEKGTETRLAKRVEFGLRVKGTGLGEKVKGHKHERVLVAKYVFLWGEGERRGADRMIGWRRGGRLCLRCLGLLGSGRRYVTRENSIGRGRGRSANEIHNRLGSAAGASSPGKGATISRRRSTEQKDNGGEEYQEDEWGKVYRLGGRAGQGRAAFVSIPARQQAKMYNTHIHNQLALVH